MINHDDDERNTPERNTPERNTPRLTIADKLKIGAPLTNPEAAAYCGLTVNALNCLRFNGRGPVYIRHGRKVMYTKAALDEYFEGLPQFKNNKEEAANPLNPEAQRMFDAARRRKAQRVKPPAASRPAWMAEDPSVRLEELKREQEDLERQLEEDME